MEREKTLAILRSLADGINPGTGEQFPAESPYQSPDAVRALFSAIHALESQDRPRNGETHPHQKPAPENAGSPWSKEEDARLGQAYDSGKSVEELAQMHKRSKWAIESRLARLGKIPAPPSRFPSRSPSGNATTNATT